MYITVAGNKKEVRNGMTLSELIEFENVEMPGLCDGFHQ